MAGRTRSFSRWVRIIHRWCSMAFVVCATLIIFPILPEEVAMGPVSGAVLAMLVIMALTGIWMAVQHYTARSRGRRNRNPGPRSARAA